MFKKSILQLHLKDKLFFLLVAILAIGGIYLGAKTAISYLSNPIKDHEEQLTQTKKLLTRLEENHGDQLGTFLHELTTFLNQLNDGPIRWMFIHPILSCLLGLIVFYAPLFLILRYGVQKK